MTKKQRQRHAAYDARNAQSDKEKLSQIICNKFISQAAYQQANSIMWYLHCRSEVRTMEMLSSELGGSKRMVIPYCTKDHRDQNKLGCWLLENLSELVSGAWGILEPPKRQWGEKGKEIAVEELDLIMVPGVAFDRQGGRLGNGAGYYDRLLQQVRPDTVLAAVCYESQLVEAVVMEQHDVYMNTVITETNCYHPTADGF